MIVTMASEMAAARLRPSNSRPERRKISPQAGGRRLQAFDRRQIKRRSDVVNYPATPAFSKST